MMTWDKAQSTFHWLPSYLWQSVARHRPSGAAVHLILCLADHFEPAILPGTDGKRASQDEQERRLERWCREYPKLVDRWRDAEERSFRHTYFYPGEQYDEGLIERLAEHCRAGWGEIEVHLHHGVEAPDTAENARRLLLEFRDALAAHGCLSQIDHEGPPRYAFVHGNYALANSADGNACGVDEEMQILAETGCYADFTLPSAPNRSQVAKINALYECGLPLDRRTPHRRGRDLECGRTPKLFPLIMQGPLMLGSGRHWRGWTLPYIENGALTRRNPPTIQRLRLWMRAAITVRGRPDWLFVKLQCHGMDPRDDETILGAPMRRFLEELGTGAQSGEYRVHFVTAREMVNIALAACDGREGNPGDYRDYRFRLRTPARQPVTPVPYGHRASVTSRTVDRPPRLPSPVTMDLYVTGGRQRKRLFTSEEEWNLYEAALILRVNTRTHTSEVSVDYQSPPEVCATEGMPSVLFKAGTLEGGKLYVCTSTEVLIYQVPEFKRIGYVSLPCFNDLHHVAPTPEGNLLVADTGLDMVVELTPEGKVLREWGVLGEDPWQRFSPSVDYRRVATTKPHRSHPNFVFRLGHDVWVTRCDQKDAVCLTQSGQRIPVGNVSVHDGHLYGGRIYFTTVDGTVVIVDQESLQVADVIDLKQIGDGQQLLGWCRGLLILDERRVWVGFTRVRKTRFHDKVNWVKHAFRDRQKPARIALYDLGAKQLLDEIDLECHDLNVIFGIFPASGA